jgi:hypothetical protein
MSALLKELVCGKRSTYSSNTTSFMYMNGTVKIVLFENIKKQNIEIKEKQKLFIEKQKQQIEEERKKEALEKQLIYLRRMPTVVHFNTYDPVTRKVSSTECDAIYYYDFIDYD